MRSIWPCPLYADFGCFTSLTEHDNEVDIIRGCSTFDQEYVCSGWTQRDLDEKGDVIRETDYVRYIL